MKLKRIAAALLALLLTGLIFSGVLFAKDSDLFVKTLPITKIYPHGKGFKILFVKSDLTLGSFYVPITWFIGSGAANKADIVYGNDPAYPYCSIFWKKGEFDHLRLYVMKDKNHETWGVLSAREDLSKFDTETLEIEF